MTYRRRHFSRPRLDAVIELIFSDLTNPRSVAYQIGILDREIVFFPGESDFGLLPKIREQLQELGQRCLNPAAPDESGFDTIFSSLEVFADMLTQHYFSHSVRHVY